MLEVNAPLVDEQLAHRELAGRAAAHDVAVRTLSAATATVCVSEEVAAWARAYSRRPEHVHVVPNGADVDRITPRRAGERWRARGRSGSSAR